jgi:hypothetical protein
MKFGSPPLIRQGSFSNPLPPNEPDRIRLCVQALLQARNTHTVI